nr:hypothetical protein [Candidatus Karelsulcia muelleri]
MFKTNIIDCDTPPLPNNKALLIYDLRLNLNEFSNPYISVL